MQKHVQFGYPTPPASPSYDNQKCHFQQPHPRHYQPAQCIPLAPEERLGRFLEGKLQLTEILGTGAYGVVYSAVDVETGVRYAVKCLSKYNPDGTPLERRQVAYQQREIRLHYLASAHCNVVSILKIVDDMDCVYVVLEYCPEGDLFLNITERGQYVGNDALAKKAFLQILDAVEHCHKLGIYHRDLKPENILVTDNAETVKLADFGLATSDDRSEDYGCGSTFYMSPECLDPSTRRPYYMCAPNDVWSLGVILVNLTCGRNPWKQASVQDSTYRAYVRSPGFLKTILPLSDELNDILGRIFHPNPEFRVTLSELRCRIMACSIFTVQPGAAVMPSPPASPEQMNEAYFAANEDAIIDDYDYDAALSPASTSSEEGSLTSSVSSLDELDEDFIQDEQHMQDYIPQTYDTEDLRNSPAMFQAPDFVPQQYTGPVAVPGIIPSQQPVHCQQAPLASHTPVSIPPHCRPQCQQPQPQPKSFFPLWEVVRLVQQAPIIHHSTPFHQQVPFLPTFQGY